MVICEYCTRDARENDPGAQIVWVEIRKGESGVLRKLPKPRVRKHAPKGATPLFNIDDGKYHPGYTDPFDNDKKDDLGPNPEVPF